MLKPGYPWSFAVLNEVLSLNAQEFQHAALPATGMTLDPQ